MKRKRILAAFLVAAVLPSQTFAAGGNGSNTKYLHIPTETTLAKSELGNPFLGFDENGDILYGGDPSILVDGDTVYAYVGHDTSEVEWYQMPDYRAYSSKDLIHWKYENKILDMTQVSWAVDRVTAWASQVIKFKGRYYLLFCTPANIEGEEQGHCIGVAECDTPAGDFVALDRPLILNSQTGIDEPWYDIDPTAWIDKDENGNDETLYIGWGNTNAYVCQADADEDGHLYVIDQNGNGIVSKADGDIVQFTFNGNPENAGFTEGSYFYRRQDENGNYYGDYYVFYAAGWREQIAYSTTDDLMSGQLTYGGVVMPPSTTSNTNHPAVFDYQGNSYFVYHTGALPWGSGFRRSACIDRFSVNEDGSIDPVAMTSAGLGGAATQIFDSEGALVLHEPFVNSLADSDYPMTKEVMVSGAAEEDDAKWELEKGKADPDRDTYVSIQSYNKPGLYLCAKDTDVVMTQDYKRGDRETDENMTFRTLEGLSGSGVTFESVARPGYYLASQDGDLVLSKTASPKACTFRVKTDTKAVSLEVLKTKRLYTAGSELNTDDIRATVCYENGDAVRIADFTTNADSINMNTVGRKNLKVTYRDGENVMEKTVPIRVVKESRTASEGGVSAAQGGPIKEFTFEDDLNGATLQTLHNSGAYTGNAVYEEGKYGSAIRLGDYGLRLHVGEALENYTLSMWVNPSEPVPNLASLAYIGSPKDAREVWVSLAGKGTGELRLWSNGDSYSWADAFAGVVLPEQKWSLVTLTQEGHRVRMYVDGEKKAEGDAARPLMSDANDIYIGVNHWDPLYKGLVDEVEIYDHALSAEEVSLLSVEKGPEEVFESAGFKAPGEITTYTGVVSKLSAELPRGVPASAASISYQSEDPDVAKADDNGYITGNTAGTAAVTTTVTVGSVTKTKKTIVTVLNADVLENLPLAVCYDMEQADGTAVLDTSGKGNDAVIVNPASVSYEKDGERTVLRMKGDDGFVALPSAIYDSLTDKEAFTIEAAYAAARQDVTSWLFCFGSKTSGVGANYLFYSPFSGNRIRAGIKDSAAERLCDTARSLEEDRYYTVDMVFDHGTISLYIDGVLAGPALVSGMSMETIVKNGTERGILGFLGKSCWSADADFSGRIDSFKVYDKALTAGEIQISNPENSKALKEILNRNLTEKRILGEYNVSAKEVLCNMNLMSRLDGMNLSWSSSRPDLIAADGTVTNPERDTQVTLTACLSYGLMMAEKTFVVTVGPMDLGELDGMLREAKELDYRMFESDSAAGMKELLESLGEDPLAEITSQQKAAEMKDALSLAASGLSYLDVCKNPWDKLEKTQPKEKAAYKAGGGEILFAIPEELENCVTVTYRSDNEEVAAYKDGKAEAIADGTAILTATVTAKADGFAMEYSTCVEVGENAGKLPFEDVSGDDWFADEVRYVYDEGIMTGLDDAHFGPDVNLSRAQFATVLYRMAGGDSETGDLQPEGTVKNFPDVDYNDGKCFYRHAVKWASSVGIIKGYEDTGMFGPDDDITREQMAAMMYRYADDKGYDMTASADLKGYPDEASVDSNIRKELEWAVGAGLISGNEHGSAPRTLDPQNSASRAVCATIIQRFLVNTGK